MRAGVHGQQAAGTRHPGRGQEPHVSNLPVKRVAMRGLPAGILVVFVYLIRYVTSNCLLHSAVADVNRAQRVARPRDVYVCSKCTALV